MRYLLPIFFIAFFTTCKKNDVPEPEPTTNFLQLISISMGIKELSFTATNADLPTDQPIVIRFANTLNKTTVDVSTFVKYSTDQALDVDIAFLDNDKTISLKPKMSLDPNTNYTIEINDQLKGANGEEFTGIEIQFTTLNPPLRILNIEVDGAKIDLSKRIKEISFMPEFKVLFSEPVSAESISAFAKFKLGSVEKNYTTTQLNDTIISFSVTEKLDYLRKYFFSIDEAFGAVVEKNFDGINLPFFTKVDTVPKFPLISDEELLTKVQSQTFKYFWDFGHPISGLARERNTSLNTVTSGGSGFGLMAMIVAIERGFVTRSEAIQRWKTIFDFLERADRFHGAWAHWMNGNTGVVIPFSQKDNGGDLVETAFLIQGMLTVRQYLNDAVAEEADLIDQINRMWKAVEWDWYTKGGEKQLYWHWSPEYEWDINLAIRGHNETQIVYVLAAASPGHSIDKTTYENGYARNGAMQNGNPFYGYELPLGNNRGGPLFFTHYSYLGLNPKNLKDQYADYWTQNQNHSLINRAYCIDNPKNYVGYSAACWGLTASDNHSGYSAHNPNNDRGVITPTAAISSIPYTPEASIEAIRHFYFTLGDRLWGEYGFYDAFNPTESWVASSFLAIDQGPIICMIENYRTELLWDLFMSAPEVQQGLDKLGFSY